MDFEYTDEQRLFSETLRKFLNTGYGFDARAKIISSSAGFSEDVWAAMAEMGILGVPFDAEHGGFGGNTVDMMVVMEALGEALVVEPYLATVGLGGRFIARGGTVAQQKQILPSLIAGKTKMAFAQTEPGARVARAGLLGAEVGGWSLIEEVVDYATALVCAEAVGAIKYAHDATLDYLKTRRQFGVPIGSFQALQHRMVDILIAYEQARSIACLACVKVETADGAERRRIVSAAKIKIADTARHVSQEAVQLHGGMGMTEELKISHTFRRLTTIAQTFGDADHHLARFAAAR